MEEKKLKEENILTLNKSIIKIRNELQNSKVKKSGKNSYAGFDYYELADFLPKLNELMLKEEVNDIFTIENEEAKLILLKGEERQEYKMPFRIYETPLTNKGVPMMQDIQYLGALNTYYKRYLYLNAFGITDGEVIDSIDNNNLKVEEKQPRATENQRQIILDNYTKEEIKEELKTLKRSKLSDLTVVEASILISKKNRENE